MAEMNHYDMDIDFKEYIRLVWHKKWFIIGLFLVVVTITFFLVQRMDPIYQTSATILLQNNQGMGDFLSEDMFSMGNNKSGTYSRMIKTRNLLNQVIQKMNLRNDAGEMLTFSELSSKLSVTPVNGTDLIQISIEDTNPVKAMEIVNSVVEAFQVSNVEMNKSALTGARVFIEEQKMKTEIELNNVEEELLKYKTNNNAIIPSEEAKQTLQKLMEIDSLKSMVEIELGSTEASIVEVRKDLTEHDEKLVSSTVITNNPLIKQYKGQITELESQLLELRSRYTSNHPDIIGLEARINHLQEALVSEVQKEISSETTSINQLYQSLYTNLVNLEVSKLANEAKVKGYEKLIEKYEKELEKLPIKELELTRLARKAAVTEDIYTLLMTKAEEIKISEAMETSDIYIVDPAYVPTHPVKPNKKMMLIIAGFLAIIVGVFSILVMEYFNTTIKTAEEIEKMLNVPILGYIPDITKFKK